MPAEMRRLGPTLAVLLATTSPCFAHNIRPIAHIQATGFPGMKQVWLYDASTSDSLVFRGNGPIETNLATGTKELQDSDVSGREDYRGHPGQQAEYFPTHTWNPGGGYPANAQFSKANGALSITLQQTPASIASLLPTSYCPGSYIATITGTDMNVLSMNSGQVCPWATISGTGVTAGTRVVTNVSGTEFGVGHYTVTPSQTAASATITNDGKWNVVGGQLTTHEAVQFQPDKGFCFVVKARFPSGGGTWPIFAWTQRSTGYAWDSVTATYPAVTQAEIDQGEHQQGSGPAWNLSTNFHYNTSAGGTYFSTNTESKATTTIEGSYHTYTACGDAVHVDYYIDGGKIATAAVPATATGWAGKMQYFLLTFSGGNLLLFPGVYDGVTTTADLASLALYMSNSAVLGTDYLLNVTGDGLGKGIELLSANLFTARYPSSQFANGVTVTTTTTVDGIPGQPIKIAVNNATFGSAQQYFSAAPLGGMISGHVYTVLAKYDYVGANPSGSAYIGIGHASANDVAYTMSGTTATLNAGSGCTGTAITTVGSHKEFTCQFTAPATGDMFAQFGPLANTNTQDVTLYSLSIRDNAPTL